MSKYFDYVEIENEDGDIILNVCEGVKRLEQFDIDSRCPVIEINIPASVKTIDFQAVAGMDYLECINVSPESKHFVVVDGCVYSSDMKTLIIYPPAKACDCFEIPSTVESIAPGAFWGATDLKCVKVGKNVKSIGYEAFAAAFPIERIYIDKNVEAIEYFLEDSDYIEVHFMSRESLVIGGVAGSAIEHWCRENAVRFCPLNEDQVEDFLASSEWNDAVPPLDYYECSQCLKKSL